MIAPIIASALVTLTIPKIAQVDYDRLLDAIAQKENWNGNSVGASGEWGPYQMTPEVWRHCRGSLRKAIKQATPSELRTAAREELHVRLVTLQMNHIPSTPYFIALAWGAGIAATLNNTASEAKRDYARCVAALYEDSNRTHNTSP